MPLRSNCNTCARRAFRLIFAWNFLKCFHFSKNIKCISKMHIFPPLNFIAPCSVCRQNWIISYVLVKTPNKYVENEVDNMPLNAFHVVVCICDIEFYYIAKQSRKSIEFTSSFRWYQFCLNIYEMLHGLFMHYEHKSQISKCISFFLLSNVPRKLKKFNTIYTINS